MLKFYFSGAPNPTKVALFLEEAGLPYEPMPVDTRKGQQHSPDYLAINPNAKVPAIVDGDVTVFDSNAILLYLGEKTGLFLPTDIRGRKTTTEWLFWQMGGLGPMAGQNHHFGVYAPEKIPYAINRYVNETNRLYGVIDRRLADRPFLVGDAYTIADMAAYPWIVPWKRQQQSLDDFVNLRRWFDAIAARPGTQRAYAKAEPFSAQPAVTEEGKKLLFGQTAASVAKS